METADEEPIFVSKKDLQTFEEFYKFLNEESETQTTQTTIKEAQT